jgi:hypothetical protein
VATTKPRCQGAAAEGWIMAASAAVATEQSRTRFFWIILYLSPGFLKLIASEHPVIHYY